MSFLVRKITRAKWPEDHVDKDTLPADGITADLRTSDNTISLWEIENKELFDNAVLALVTNCDKISKMDFVLLNYDDFSKHEVLLKKTAGSTAYTSYSDNHYDIVNVNYEKLGVIADYVHSRILEDEYFIRKRDKEIRNILINAIKEKKIELNKLKDSMKDDLTKYLECS